MIKVPSNWINKEVINISKTEEEVLTKVLTDLRNRKRLATQDFFADDSSNAIYFDVDSTLILYKPPTANSKPITIIDQHNTQLSVYPHLEHINKLKQHKAEGMTVVIWSAAGHEWAKIVAKELGIANLVDVFLSKPRFYYDDLEVKEWFGKRIYLGYNETNE